MISYALGALFITSAALAIGTLVHSWRTYLPRLGELRAMLHHIERPRP